MKMPKYLGEQVQLTVILKDEETVEIAIAVGGYAEDRTFVGKFQDAFSTSRDVIETMLAACKSGRQDMSNKLGLEIKDMKQRPCED